MGSTLPRKYLVVLVSITPRIIMTSSDIIDLKSISPKIAYLDLLASFLRSPHIFISNDPSFVLLNFYKFVLKI